MEYSKGAHTVYVLQYHIVWITKCRPQRIVCTGPAGGLLPCHPEQRGDEPIGQGNSERRVGRRRPKPLSSSAIWDIIA